jgi:hypothetical protein
MKEISFVILSAFRSCVKFRFFVSNLRPGILLSRRCVICTSITAVMTDPYTAWHFLSPLISHLFVLVHSSSLLSGVLNSQCFAFILILVWGPFIGFWMGACTPRCLCAFHPPPLPSPRHTRISFGPTVTVTNKYGTKSDYYCVLQCKVRGDKLNPN